MKFRWYDWGAIIILVDILLLAGFWYAFVRGGEFSAKGPVFGRVNIRSLVNAHQASVFATVGDQIKAGMLSDTSVNGMVQMSKEFYQRLTVAMSDVADQHGVVLLNADAVLAMPAYDAVAIRDYTEEVNALLARK